MLNRKSKGFTLIEMLIVMVIIAVLAAIVLPRILSARQRANEANARQTLSELRTAVQNFQADTGLYPTALAGVVATAAPSNGLAVEGTATASRSLTASYWHGPYMENAEQGVPTCILTGTTTWLYTTTPASLVGTVKVPSALTGSDIDGVAYSLW